jgi:hypothetical protein
MTKKAVVDLGLPRLLIACWSVSSAHPGQTAWKKIAAKIKEKAAGKMMHVIGSP